MCMHLRSLHHNCAMLCRLCDVNQARCCADACNRSYDNPGMSWRVGVAGMMDSAALARLGPIGMAIIAESIVSSCHARHA